MAQRLSKLLGAEEPMFSIMIQGLESASGKSGLDVRLLSDVVQNAISKLKELGLDPNDTTGKELYSVLVRKINDDDALISRDLGLSADARNDEIFSKVKSKIDSSRIPRGAWVIKKSVMRRLLKNSPPAKIMKLLGYKTVDSMLKRENILELALAMRIVETELWLRRFSSNYAKLKPTDFEERDIEIVLMSYEKWGDSAGFFIGRKGHHVIHLKEMGVAGFAPLGDQRVPCLSLVSSLMTLYYVNEIRTYSSYLKINQVKPNFSQILCDVLTADSATGANLLNQPIHWRIIQRHIGSIPVEGVEVFAPYVQKEDLVWKSAEESLEELYPGLSWWTKLNYTGLIIDDQPVSFNCVDNALSASHSLDFAHRYYSRFKADLWNELYRRYVGHPALEVQVIQQLTDESVAPETVAQATSEGAV